MADQVQDTPLSGGQNEGIERSLLPLPQLASVINGRMRKASRWGKRSGTTALSAATTTGNALGSGTGAVRTVGPGLCLVDDQCYVYDGIANAWLDPKKLAPVNSSAALFVACPRLPGAVSGWLPDTAFFPVPPLNGVGQTRTPCAQAYALGRLWTAVTFIDPASVTDVMIRVVATDPTTQAVTFLQDIRALTAGDGGVTYPRLVVCGSTLVLGYASRLGGASLSIMGRVLTSLSGGFGNEIFVTASIGSGGIYDMAPYDATRLLCVTTNTNLSAVSLLSASTLASLAGISYTDALATITGSSIVGSPTAGVFYTVTATGGGSNATRVSAYTASLGAHLGTANVATDVSYPSYSVLLPGGGVRCVFGYQLFGTMNVQALRYRDVSAAGAIASIPLHQASAQPISRPFAVGPQVYVWTTNVTVNGAFGYAQLLRLPGVSEYSGTFPAGLGLPVVSVPLEMSAQDFLVRTGPPNVDPKGLPAVTQIGTSATWAVLYPALTSFPDINVPFAHEFRVVQATHFSDSPGQLSVNVVGADAASFVPGGVLTRVDQRGAVEEGFCDPPRIVGTAAVSTGHLTPSTTYQYCAVFVSRNANGRFEQSQPSTIFSHLMSASENTMTLQWEPLAFGARQDVSIEIYRTASDGSVFNLLTTVDGQYDGSGVLASATYTDTSADQDIAGHKVLYTQVGNQLPNSFPPACRFAAVGGQRVFLGGLLRGDVMHASKFVIGDQNPSWCDSDSFRIVAPGPLTGAAWMDNLVLFTDEGVYVVSGDGPDDDGGGAAFSPPVRLPFALGCVEPRSVITVDEGTFFQTSRGLYMLPRGFGAPVPAGEAVLDTLAAFPVITGVAALTTAKEQTVRWTCVDSPAAAHGVQVVYDLVHKVWSVDRVGNVVTANATAPHTTVSAWTDGQVVMAEPTLSASVPFKKSVTSSFSDLGMAIPMSLVTGDVRAHGLVSHGLIGRLYVLAELRSACTLSVQKTTDLGTSPAATRTFSGAGPDYVPGQLTYTECSLGNAELRDVTSLALTLSESSASEGLAFIGVTLESGAVQGLKLLKPADRVT